MVYLDNLMLTLEYHEISQLLLGGAWSPIGDVTTIMLWIGGQVTS